MGFRPGRRWQARAWLRELLPCTSRGFVAMAHAGGVPHRVLALRVASAEAMIAAAHPMATTLFLTHHPDISIAPPA